MHWSPHMCVCWVGEDVVCRRDRRGTRVLEAAAEVHGADCARAGLCWLVGLAGSGGGMLTWWGRVMSAHVYASYLRDHFYAARKTRLPYTGERPDVLEPVRGGRGSERGLRPAASRGRLTAQASPTRAMTSPRPPRVCCGGGIPRSHRPIKVAAHGRGRGRLCLRGPAAVGSAHSGAKCRAVCPRLSFWVDHTAV